jgi:hypothetical protein
MNGESAIQALTELFQSHFDEAAGTFDEDGGDDDDFQNRLEAMIRKLQWQAYEVGLEQGMNEADLDTDTISVVVNPEDGWKMARNLMYGSPIVIQLNR